MKRIVLAVTVAGILALAGSSLQAHHGYANYDTDHRVCIEGDVQEIRFMNPHIVMLLRTVDSKNYAAVWQAASWVDHLGVTKNTFKVGDHLFVFGAPSRIPGRHEVATLREVRRPSDGWYWHADQDGQFDCGPNSKS
jgi:Family of unknown function (DUF6152)